MGYRTGIRSGIAHEDTLHVSGSTKAGTLCGSRPAKWAPRPMTLHEMERHVARQGGKLCRGCRRRLTAILG